MHRQQGIADVCSSRQTAGMSKFKPIAIGGLAVLLLSAVVATIYLYQSTTRPTIQPGDEAVIARARLDSDLAFHRTSAQRPDAVPVVVRLSDRTCVELRSRRPDGAGDYLVCYAGRTGNKLEERATIGF